MARKGEMATIAGVILAVVGLAIVDYKLKHAKCQHCDLALEAVTLAQNAICPNCGKVVTAFQALLA